MKAHPLSLAHKLLIFLPILGLGFLALYYPRKAVGVKYEKVPKWHVEVAMYTAIGVILWGILLFAFDMWS